MPVALSKAWALRRCLMISTALRWQPLPSGLESAGAGQAVPWVSHFVQAVATSSITGQS
jgi:hypothetical protein